MDPISAMLGLDIDDEEKTRALAERLRGRKSAADFFSLSTVKPISRMAIAEQGDVLDSAKTAGGLRRARAARDAAAQLQQDSLAARVTAADVKEGRRQAALTAKQDYDADLLGKQRSYDEGMADYDTYINPDDQATINVRQQGGGLVDSLGAPADISGMMPIGDYDAPAAALGLKPPAKAQSNYFEAGNLLKQIGGINDVANSFTEGQRAEANQPVSEIGLELLDKWGPEGAARLAESELVYPDKQVRNWMSQGRKLENRISQLASGLAVTGYEMQARKSWSPWAPGIPMDERQQRLDNVQVDFRDKQSSSYEGYPGYFSKPDWYAEEAEVAAPAEESAPTQTRTVNGKTYIQVDGQWYEQ